MKYRFGILCACATLLAFAAWFFVHQVIATPDEPEQMIELQTLVAHRMPDDFKAAVEADKGRAVLESGRSIHWGAFSDRCLDAHPWCSACGVSRESAKATGNLLAAHHIHVFHLMTPEQRGTAVPGGELDPHNIIVLCFRHHFEIGHLRNWKNENPHVVADVSKFAKALRARGAWP